MRAARVGLVAVVLLLVVKVCSYFGCAPGDFFALVLVRLNQYKYLGTDLCLGCRGT